jgi:SPP1 gp7 family putative phage head morphogenesis protein
MAKKANRVAEDIATEIQSYLERLKSGQVQEYSKIFPKLERLAADAVGSLRVDKLSEASIGELNKALSTLRTTTTELYMHHNDELVDALGSIGGFVMGKEIGSFRSRLGESIAGTEWSIPNAKRVFKEVLQRPIRATGELLEPFTRSVIGPTIRKMEGAIRNGYTEGETVGSVMRKIRGTKAAGYRDGILQTSRHQAEAMVRTATQHVANASRMEFFKDNDDLVKGYRWLSTLDGVTSAQCRSLDGQVFEFNKGPIPPAHPNCRSTITPELGSEFDFLDEGATRSSADGYVDANQTYYEWLKGKDDAFIDDVLGPSRGKLFRDGGLSTDQFARLNLDRRLEPLTLKEMYAKDPTAFRNAGVVPRGVEDLIGEQGDIPSPEEKEIH